MKLRWLCLGWLSACGGGSDESCGDPDQPARLHVINETGNTFAEIVLRSCDGTMENAVPLPPPGLADGEERTIELPTPGCWEVSYTGDGCFNVPVHETPEVCGGQTHEWVADLETHACAGH
jgi:hypothetical protein